MILHVTWDITPLSPPVPHRHCATCNTTRPFHCAETVRLNANGHRLDAWLIYKCATCDRTWNLPILERVGRGSLSQADLTAMHHSDPAWVHRFAHDLPRLARYSGQIDLGATRLDKRLAGPWSDAWSTLILSLQPQGTLSPRLDRLLGAELGLSRSTLSGLFARGAFQSSTALHKPFRGPQTLSIQAALLTDAQHRAISAGVADAP